VASVHFRPSITRTGIFVLKGNVEDIRDILNVMLRADGMLGEHRAHEKQ